MKEQISLSHSEKESFEGSSSLTEEKDSREVHYLAVWNNGGKEILVACADFPKIRSMEEYNRAVKESFNTGTKFTKNDYAGLIGFEKYTVDRDNRPEWLRGEIERYREFGVRDIRLEINRPDGAGATLWYKNDDKGKYSFWGIKARMALAWDHNPGILIRPRLTGRKIFYDAFSWDDGPFINGWEASSKVDRQSSWVNGEVTEEEFVFSHMFGVQEKVMVRLAVAEDKARLMLKREVKIWVEEPKIEVYKKAGAFDPSSVELEIPLVFPAGILEFTSPAGISLGPNTDEAEKVFRKHQEIDQLFRQILPPKI